MKKLFIISAFILIGSSAFSQVGINNTDPKASLDITASSLTTPSYTDGILIPRVDEFPATAPGADQDGLMVFATGSGTPAKGFYFWDNTGGVWIGFGGTNNTLDEAYDQGGAGAGRIIDASDGAMTINGDDGLVVTGTFGAGNIIDTDVSGAGTRLFFNPNKGTIRAGAVSGVQWDDTNIGEYSAAFGFDNIASGNISFAMGLGNTASAESATAFGSSNTASGQESVTFGNQNTASGLRSTAMGTLSNASGDYALASGDTAEASALNTIALGNGTIANAADAVAIGKNSIASLSEAIAIGGGNASGANSTSIGSGTVASSYGEIAIGIFNTGYVPNSMTAFDSDDRLLSVGNGISNGNRNNALTILKNGYTGINTDNPRNPLDIQISTSFDLSYFNSGQDGIFILGEGDNSGNNAVGGSISFGPPSSTRGSQRKSAIASVQTSGDVDHTGLAFYVHGNAINMSDMVEGMRLTHNRRLGINNTDPSANLDVIGTMQYEDGNEAAGYVLSSDATGNASWVDPTTIINTVEKINDLSDGKSDNDGTNDGSSVFLGVSSGAADDSNNNRNVGVGFQTLEDNTTGSQNTALGYNSLLNNIDGSANTAVGSGSLDANTTGIWNTAVGQAALSGNVDGAYNTAIGRAALLVNSDGNSNVAVGVNAFSGNSSGDFNTVIGVDAATGLDSSSNTIIGRRAMNSYSSGGENVAIGASAGYYGSGTQNTYLGTTAGFSPSAPARSGSVFLGYGAGSSETASNKLYIENSTADADNALIYGEFDTNTLRVNGEVQIGNPTSTGYALPLADGTAAQVLSTDGSGATSWQDSPSNFALAKMSMSADQTLVAGPNKLNFDTADFDLNSNFDPSTDRFDVTETGYYRINANFRNTSSITSTAFFDLSVRINGTTIVKSDTRGQHGSTNVVARSVSTIEFLTAGDFIEVFASGTGLVITRFSSFTAFEVERIR